MSETRGIRRARFAALATAFALVLTGIPVAAQADSTIDDSTVIEHTVGGDTTDDSTIDDSTVVELPGPAVAPAPATRAASVATDRIAGQNRFETAVEVSKRIIPTGKRAPVVYIASGASFADALTAGPAASVREGVLLLVSPNFVPPVVAAELLRINPERVIIAGEVGAIPAPVAAQVAALVKPGTPVDRIGGRDRYETGRLIVREAFSGPVRVTRVMIATGRDFPDALAGGAAAAAFGEPVIIVNGSASQVDGPTLALLDDLGVSWAAIAGGPGVVSPGILDHLKHRVDVAERASQMTGNRYQTATGINTTYFGKKIEGIPTQALVVSGTGYADALAAIPLAGKLSRDSKFTSGAVYLSSAKCIPAPGSHYIGGWDRVTLVGGLGVLGNEVASLGGCW